MVTGMLGSGINVDEVTSSFLLTDIVPEEKEGERETESKHICYTFNNYLMIS